MAHPDPSAQIKTACPPAAHPFHRVLDILRERGTKIRMVSDVSARVRCPTHDDAKPSLVVTHRDDRVLVRCFGGCKTVDVLKALGLRLADLYTGPKGPRRRPEIAAAYDYRNLAGELIAQKVRYEPKEFRWRRPDVQAPDAWRWGLEGIRIGLYRLNELVGHERVFLTEGEKAADLLARYDLAATCPPAGASSWTAAWSEDLCRTDCRELVILIDNDAAGRRHAERVAAETYRPGLAAGLQIRLLALPSLPPAGDVVDWLGAGHTVTELETLTRNVPVWDPGAAARRRTTKRRQQGLERVRRHREKRRLEAGGTPRQRSKAELRSEAVGVALEAVCDVLRPFETGQSGRGITALLRNLGYTRNVIGDALRLGVERGTLVGHPGSRNAIAYRLSPGGQIPGQSPAASSARVTSTGQSTGVPPILAVSRATQLTGSPSKQHVTQCPDTRDPVTQGERTSVEVQKTLSKQLGAEEVTGKRVTQSEQGVTSHTPILDEDSIEGEGLNCCEGGPIQLRCKLCRHSPTYWLGVRQ